MNFKKHLNARLRAKFFTSVFLTVFLDLVPLAARAQFEYEGTNYTSFYKAVQNIPDTPGTYTITMTGDGLYSDEDLGNNNGSFSIHADQTVNIVSDTPGTQRSLEINTYYGVPWYPNFGAAPFIVEGDATLNMTDIIITASTEVSTCIFNNSTKTHTWQNCKFYNIRGYGFVGNLLDFDLRQGGGVIRSWVDLTINVPSGALVFENCSVNWSNAWSDGFVPVGGGVIRCIGNLSISEAVFIDCHFYEKADSSAGGAIFVNCPYNVAQYYFNNPLEDLCTITTERGLTFEGCYSSRGGAVGSHGRLTINGNITCTNCRSLNGCGGGVYAANDFTINGTVSCTDCHTDYFGGGLASLKGAVTITGNATITNCTARERGGGIYANLSVTLAGEANVISGCKTKSSYSWNLIGNGGGICCLRGGNIRNTLIEGNEAKSDGGGIYNDGYPLTLTNVTCRNNTAKNGGGVYTRGGTFTVSGGSYTNNTATTGNGGGFYLQGGTPKYINSPSIVSNSALNGGGIYSNANTTMSAATLDGNTASQDGAGIYMTSGKTITATGATFINNVATGNGGGIYANGGTLTNCTIGAVGEANTAVDGAGVYLQSGTLVVSDGSYTNNEASNDGGGVYLASSSTYTATGTTFSANTADGNGGAIYTEGSSSTTTTMIPYTWEEIVQLVEYIEVDVDNITTAAPTDVPYINTGITFDGGQKTWAKGKRNNNNEVFLLYAYSGTGNSQRAGYKPLGSNIQHAWPDKGNTTSGNSYTTGTDINGGPFEVEQDATHIKVTDHNDVVTELSYSGNASATMGSTTWTLLRPYVNGSKSRGRLYEAKIWNASNVLIAHYKPCYRVSTDEIGVYDVVSGKFFGNAGGGSFTKGGDITGSHLMATFTEYVTVTTPVFNVNLNDVTIGASGNPNTATKGGGIYINQGGLSLNTGSVGHNTASEFGGGVYISTNSEFGVSGTVTVKNNTTTRSSDLYLPYLKDTYEDDVCLQTLNDDPGSGSIGKIRLMGALGSGTNIGITEQPVASGFDRSIDAEGNKIRQFTLNYGTFYSSKSAKDVFFSNDKYLDIYLLTHPHPGTTTGLLEVTLGEEPIYSWYVAGIVDDDGITWGDDENNSGLAPDVPLRTLTGPNGVFAKGYNPLSDHIFVVRAVSMKAEAEAGRLTGGNVIIRYPDNATAATFLNNTDPIPDIAGSEEVILHRYPGGHTLSKSYSAVGWANTYDTGNTDGTGTNQTNYVLDGNPATPGINVLPGANIGPVLVMDDEDHEAKLYDIHMDGLSEYDELTDHEVDPSLPSDGSKDTHNPRGLYISPKSALLSVESDTKAITLNEHCDLLLNNNKDGGDNSGTLREIRTGGAVYNAGTLVCNGAIIRRNHCHTHGGGIFLKDGMVTLNDECSITYNNATNFGGGAYISADAVMNLNGSGTDGVLIRHNHATGHGGGVYKLGSLKVQGLINIEDNTSGTE